MEGEDKTAVDEQAVAGELLRAAGLFGVLVMGRLQAQKPREARELLKVLARGLVEFKVVVRNVTSGQPSVQLVIGRGEDDDQVVATLPVARVQTLGRTH